MVVKAFGKTFLGHLILKGLSWSAGIVVSCRCILEFKCFSFKDFYDTEKERVSLL